MKSNIIRLPVEVQYNFFETKEESEWRALINGFEEIKKSLDKQRRSQFAKIGEQNKKIMDLESRLEAIEYGICKGEICLT